MSFLEDRHDKSIPLLSAKEDFLIKEIVGTHDPDGRQLDSEQLLLPVESTFYSTRVNVFDAQIHAIATGNICLTEPEEPIPLIIYKISNEILCQSFEDENLHSKALALLEMLSKYGWDAKVVMALASFACNFGLFWLILQLQPNNALAVSLATIKLLPRAISVKPKFKALNLLVNTMLKLTKLIVSFEAMSQLHELVDEKDMDITKSKIYMATYWIFRSVLLCSSQIADLRNLDLEQVYSDKAVIAAWGLHSVGSKLNSLFHDLGEHVVKCQQQIETRFYNKLLDTFKDNQVNNQKALRMLFALQNEFPLKNSSSGEKCGIIELENKVVILLISKPELLPVDKILWLAQQTSCDHPQRKKFEGSYAILWVPIPSSREWSLADKTNFEFFSNCLPWFSIRRPWSLNLTVVNYIRQEWNFKGDPIMVVLNDDGMVTNSNAMDMMWIWGPKAFPFSSSREKELWGQEDWTIDLVIDGISPLLNQWVEEDRNLCIYGSDSLDWIREFSAAMKKIKSAGIQLEVVCVGSKNSGENVKAIIDAINQEELCTSLTYTEVHFFWFRLERIKRSTDDKDYATRSSETIKAKLAAVLEMNNNKSWAVIGKGSSTDVLELEGENLKECFELFPLWSKNVAAMGLVGAIRSALEPPLGGGQCNHIELIPYEEGLDEKPLICDSCKRPMEKFFLYTCDA